VLFGETLIKFEEIKLRQKEIEVRALVALSRSKNEVVSFKATQKLKMFAYPEEVAKELDQPTIGEYE
jgi:aspartate carbamoyltransferase regulatory subunit